MNKIGICIWSFSDDTPAAVKKVKDFGMDAIELQLGSKKDGNDLTDPALQKAFMDAGREYGVDFPSIGANALCHSGMSMDVESSKVILKSVFQVALNMGIPTLQLPSFLNGVIEDEEGYQKTLECLKYICELCAPHGIKVGWENIMDAKTNLRMIGDVAPYKLYVYFDNANTYCTAKMDGLKMIDELYPHIVETHLKEMKDVDGSWKFTTFGKGDSYTNECIKAFQNNGYDGYYILENGYDKFEIDGDFDTLLAQDIAAVKKCLSEV